MRKRSGIHRKSKAERKCGSMQRKKEKQTGKTGKERKLRHFGRAGVVGSLILLFLSGCSGRELEARDFVSVLTFSGEDPEKLLAEQQRTDSRILDYSHTRAVLLTERAVQEPEQLDQVLESLILRPEFSWNLLIFTGGEEVLQKAEEKKEKLGLELAAYYRNHQEKQGISSPVTLLDLWNWRLGKEGGELKLPVLVLRDGSLLPEGVLTVQLSDRSCYKKKQEAKHSLPA